MGYCIKLISKKEIREDDVKSIIFNLPDYLKGPLNDVKEQEWGWPCVCDVNKPNGKELIISGSYAMSGDKAQDFTFYIKHALDKLGYDVDIAYTYSVLFDEIVFKDDKKIKLNPEINIDIPIVKLRENTCKQIPVIKSSTGCIKIKILIILLKLFFITLFILYLDCFIFTS